MRLRLTIEFQRTPKPAPTPEVESPSIYDLSGAQVEQAGYQPLGFQITPPRTEDRA